MHNNARTYGLNSGIFLGYHSIARSFMTQERVSNLGFQKIREHRSERSEIASSQLTDTGKYNKD